MTTKKNTTPSSEPTDVTFRAEGLDLIATLPDGKGTEVTVSMSMPMGAFKELLPKMNDLEGGIKGEGGREPDPVQILETFESILPDSVIEATREVHMPWAMAIYMEWVSRLGGLMGKALSG